MWIALLILVMALGIAGILMRSVNDKKPEESNLADEFEIIEDDVNR